ncbi:MAG TPA: phosphate ABC transporter ATP-binding protein [Thermoanaerobaculaceae bacterium]|mgnify:CR=1 FL=1|nr:phosphate ABC transporter ATP-binding protein [Thermoanaerobaculaceae bacterium]HRS14663.1 phosphate ABC transporter ATP-binding protein [Thermoanaerobaculaceae bacterium]
MSAAPSALETRNLYAGFGDTEVLRGITLAVPARRVTALIGPSGCGKSTLLRCFNRMNDHLAGFFRRGAVLVEGRDVYDPAWSLEALRFGVGMVFQKPNPFPLSIRDNVLFGPTLAGVKDRTALEETLVVSLQRANLWDEVKDALGRSALQLSGGQQQRLCIARALASSPDALLLDEPASALDPIATAKLEEAVLELAQHVTVLLVTHNLQQAARVASRTAFLYLGALVEEGDTAELFSAPREKLTEEYITGRFG